MRRVGDEICRNMAAAPAFGVFGHQRTFPGRFGDTREMEKGSGDVALGYVVKNQSAHRAATGTPTSRAAIHINNGLMKESPVSVLGNGFMSSIFKPSVPLFSVYVHLLFRAVASLELQGEQD